MGLNVMRWPIRPTGSKKYQVNIMLHSLEGLSVEDAGDENIRLFVGMKWKGPWGSLGSRFAMKRLHSQSVSLGRDGVVQWDHSFENLCAFSISKDGAFQPWPITVSVFKRTGVLRARPLVVGTVPVDLGSFAGNAAKGIADENLRRFPITCNLGGSTIDGTVSMSIAFIELRNVFEGFESVHKLVAPAIACMGEPMWDSDDEKSSVAASAKRGSPLKALNLKSKKKVSRELDGIVSPTRSEGKSPSSEGSSRCSDNPFDSDSPLESDVDEYILDGEEVFLEKSISYGTLAGANLVAEEVIPFHRNSNVAPEDSEVMTIHSRATTASYPKTAVVEEPALSEIESSRQSPLSFRNKWMWGKKRKIPFGSSPRSRGEPLLNKSYGEEGGDEIDWDRRQSDAVSSDEKRLLISYHSGEGLSATSSNVNEVLDFGDELFTVGSWEMKEFTSRDGKFRMSANVFFASFDQRSESAAGESACTALVAVIADWLNTHPGLMPSKAEFDILIRDGSTEWRKLCEVEEYKERFPDRHFDLDTVLEAEVRPLRAVSDRSFVGFFQPERVGDLGEFDFLKEAMTFDAIWDAIERAGPALYIVSWNDHFFVLRFEQECCYIIDTLGERLYEGCNQAYILHFDESTTLSRVPAKDSKDSKDSKDLKDLKDSKDSKVSKDSRDSKDSKDSEDLKDSKRKTAATPAGSEIAVLSEKGEGRQEGANRGAGVIVCEANGAEVSSRASVYGGKGACRQFVKGFFAAIQLREVELEAKKCGKSSQMSIYRKLQIEFHYVKALDSFPTYSSLGLNP